MKNWIASPLWGWFGKMHELVRRITPELDWIKDSVKCVTICLSATSSSSCAGRALSHHRGWIWSGPIRIRWQKFIDDDWCWWMLGLKFFIYCFQISVQRFPMVFTISPSCQVSMCTHVAPRFFLLRFFFAFFPQTMWPHWRGSYGYSKRARVWPRWARGRPTFIL